MGCVFLFPYVSQDAQLSAVLQAANLQLAALEMVTNQREHLLETKNRAMKDLHFELAKVAQAHEDVVRGMICL